MRTQDLTTQIRAFVASLEASGGEADDTTEDLLGTLVAQADDKAEALVYTLQRLEMEAKGERELEQLHQRRRAAAERAAERVRSLLLQLVQGRLELTGEAKARTQYGTAYLVHTTRVDGPEAAEDWPETYRRTKTTILPDREGAKAALQKGEAIPGLRLVEAVSVGVRRG